MIIGAILEEQRLMSEYGDDYARYQQATPMFIPNLSRLTHMK